MLHVTSMSRMTVLVLAAAACSRAGTADPGGGAAPAPVAGATDPSAADAAPLRLLKAYLESFNAGDLARHARFHVDHLLPRDWGGATPEEGAARDIDLRDAMGGGLELYHVVSSSATEVRAILRERGGLGWHEFMFGIDPARPEIIATSRLGPAPAPEEARPARMNDEALARDLDRLLQKLTAEDRFSGAVLIARRGTPFFEKAYGHADREKKIPNDMDTKFRIGSMNKMFTSVAIAQLVQKRKLAYTDTLAKLLPDYPDKDIAAVVTVHHLLTHTSGLGDFFGPEFDKRQDSLRTVKDYLPLFAGKPLSFEPGASWSYSNAGMIVAGLVVERRSGMSYFDYVRKHVFRPAGMLHSDTYAKTAPQPHQSIGYTRRDRRWVPNFDTLPLMGSPAGGGDSTPRDLLRFDRALRANKLVSAALTAEITSGKVSTPRAGRYAYGFIDEVIAGQRVVGHGGGAPGMNANLDMYWDSDCTVIVMANLDPPIAQKLSVYIRDRIQP